MYKGMMWFDNDPATTLETKVRKAAAFYQNKHGSPATCCMIHPATAGEPAVKEVIGIEITTSRSVLPNHFWMGVKSS